MRNIFLSVVIPCYNEERNLRLGALENVSSYLHKQKYSWEVILVNDGSSDSSKNFLLDFIKDHPGFLMFNKKHQGKAAAVTYGILKSKGKYLLFTDLDQATPINQIIKLLPLFSKGYQVVIGSRNKTRQGAPFLRRAMALGFIILRNLILNLQIQDTQCGFKAFTKTAADDIFSHLRVFDLKRSASGSTVTAGFDIELLYVSKLLGYKIAEVPVDWFYQETRNVNPLKDSVESLFDLVRIKINSLIGKYQQTK